MRTLLFLFLLEYLVSWIQATAPIMTAVKEIKTYNENDISARGNVLFDFSTVCALQGGSTGPKLFTYTYDPATTTTILDAQTDGKIKMLTTAVLDYEVKSQYNIWAKCNDTATNEVATEEGAFSLVLNNVNEDPSCPTCTTPKTIWIDEQAAADYIIPDDNGIAVTDPDTNDQLSWSVLDCTGKDFFSITPSAGKPATVTIKTKVPFDYEDTSISSQPCKELLIKIEDPGGKAVTGTVSICCRDNNDNTPVFNPTTYSASNLGIGTPKGTAVTPVTATDADASATNQITTYEVSTLSQAYPYFEFAGSTLQIGNPIDVQWAESFTVLVLAIDGGVPTKRTGTATVTIFTTTTTTTTTTVAPPSGYNFWDKKDNVIAFICLMVITGLIVGALCYGCYRYCKHGSCLPECCSPNRGEPENQNWAEKQNNQRYDRERDDQYNYARTPTPHQGTTSISQIGYH